MSKFIKTATLVIILVYMAYSQRGFIRDQFVPVWDSVKENVFHVSPCASPVPYAIGDFDAKFGVSEKYFLEALSEAEAIWEKPSGKNLFEYRAAETARNVVKVNLVYDYRQQATVKMKAVGSDLSSTRAEYDAMKADFTDKKSVYDADIRKLNAQIKEFNQKNETYKTTVEYWNSKGGAPEKEYAQLQKDRAELEVQAEEIKKLQSEINKEVEEINNLVGDLNRLASELNITVDKYNTIGASRGEAFEEGLYKSDGVNKEIDIYEFSSKEKLVRVLAHELGHALGLDHVSDTEAVMYELNQGKKLEATKGDLAALETLCKNND